MKERKHSNVKFVITGVHKRVIYKNILHLFMKERNYSNVKYVTKNLHKSQI